MDKENKMDKNTKKWVLNFCETHLNNLETIQKSLQSDRKKMNKKDKNYQVEMDKIICKMIENEAKIEMIKVLKFCCI